MRINYLLLQGFKRFHNSKIQRMEINNFNNVNIIIGNNNSGKENPNSSLLRTNLGWKPMGEIKVGDMVLTRDGSYTKVLGVFPQGIKSLYRVIFEDGRYCDCGRDHLWCVHRKYWDRDRYAVFDTQFLMMESQGHHSVYYVPLVQPEQNSPRDFYLHPYVLGVLIGDGSLTGNTISVSTDEWIINKCNDLLPEGVEFHFQDVNKKFNVDYTKVAHIACKREIREHFFKFLDENNLRTTAYYKHIPEEYFEGSYEQRLALLQGLMDTDGCLSIPQVSPNTTKMFNKAPEFSTTSEQLIKDIQRLVWSLGGKFRYSSRVTHYTHKGEKRDGAVSYRGVVRLRKFSDIFSLPRKKNCFLADDNSHREDILKLRILSITPLPDKEECTCIYVEHPEHLYVVGKEYVVTHNTSLLYAICPLPNQRSEFERNGYKEEHIEHNGHLYNLISDFSNRNSPHQFLMDGVELNVSHTTDVQTELVEKHFGITPIIRDLVYSKIQLCRTTKAERKSLFLKINPMKLGLILDTHKKVQSKIKDCKANLSHLYSRKTDLEGRLIAPEVLEKHKKTKDRLNEQLLVVDKILYSLEQHVVSLKDRFKSDLQYADTCAQSNIPIIPSDQILDHCHKLLREMYRFTDIPRGDAFYTAKESLKIREQQLLTMQGSIETAMTTLVKEIDEIQTHLESTADRPISKIEKEIADIDIELEKYKNIPENTIPFEHIEAYKRYLSRIQQIVHIFKDSGVEMIEIEELDALQNEANKLKYQLSALNNESSQLSNITKNQERELENIKTSAGVPSGCQFDTCGLKTILFSRVDRITKEYNENAKQLERITTEQKELSKKFEEIVKKLEPFNRLQLKSLYIELSSLFNHAFLLEFLKEETLLYQLNTQPLLLIKKVSELINVSLSAEDRRKLLEQKSKLEVELKALIKTSGTNKKFLIEQIEAKEKSLKEMMEKLNKNNVEYKATHEKYNLYLEYLAATDEVHKFQEKYNQGERALLVSKALDYWKALGRKVVEIKNKLNQDLRELETLVKEQEMYRNTYQNEIVKWMDKIEKDKIIYEKIEMALSPTTGMPHKSMVKYLNVLINNVNYFISQIWTSSLKILPMREDQPLDYGFRIEQNGDVTDDITHLSDGQTEVMNLAWVLTILLQMKVLDKVPFFSDELARTFDPTHRQKVLQFMGALIDKKTIGQLFITSHMSMFTDGFTESDVICLEGSNLMDLPSHANLHVTLN